ncbi:MAG: hypothetical protein HY536_00770 [Candidatus Colwellbacteria bacterium]|nr:hypothetical protein [Candidatus Colwellbacteria bacterium]
MWLTYLVRQIGFRIAAFFSHWYVGSFRVVARTTVSLLESLDRTFAFKVTLRHMLEPMYKDYTIIGYILGFSLRSARLTIGGVLYLALIACAVALYVAWALVLPSIVYWGFFL